MNYYDSIKVKKANETISSLWQNDFAGFIIENWLLLGVSLPLPSNNIFVWIVCLLRTIAVVKSCVSFMVFTEYIKGTNDKGIVDK